MVYTSEQYDLLETFEKGRLVQELSVDELYIYRFLIDEKLLQPRADIKDGWHLLSEQGKRVLENRQKQICEASEKKAADKKSRIKDRIFQTFLVILGYTLGLLTDNIGTVCDWVCSFFK